MLGTELATITEVNAIEVFEKDGMDKLLQEIKDKVKGEVFDITTAKGRKNCVAMAARVSSSMAHIEKVGKELKEPHLAAGKVIDANRKKAKDELSELRDDTRRPVTEWENLEKDRVKKLQDNIDSMINRGNRAHLEWMSIDLDQMKTGLEEIEATELGEEIWGDLADDAKEAKEHAIAKVTNGIAMREKYIKDQAELEDLKKEKALQEQKDRDSRMREEGEKKAALDAKETEERLEREKKEALQREQDAIENAEKAERIAEEDRVAREKQNALDIKNVEQDAKDREEKAAQNERDRIENARLQEEADAKKREANKKHRGAINTKAVDALVLVGLSKDAAKQAVTAIAGGSVPNVTIRY